MTHTGTYWVIQINDQISYKRLRGNLLLILFEKQTKRFKIEEKNRVSSLLSLMPSDIVELIARISEEEFENYLHVKGLIRMAMNSQIKKI